MRVISFLAQETRDTVAINYVSPTIETVIHQDARRRREPRNEADL